MHLIDMLHSSIQKVIHKLRSIKTEWTTHTNSQQTTQNIATETTWIHPRNVSIVTLRIKEKNCDLTLNSIFEVYGIRKSLQMLDLIFLLLQYDHV